MVTQKRQHSEKEGEIDASHERKAQEPDRKTPMRGNTLSGSSIWIPDHINRGSL